MTTPTWHQGVEDLAEVAYCLYVPTGLDEDPPEMLRQLRMAVAHGRPVVYWRRPHLLSKPLPSLLSDYQDLLVIEGTYAEIRMYLFAYLVSRHLFDDTTRANLDQLAEL